MLTTEQERLENILDSLQEGNFFTIKEVLESKYFRRCFGPPSESMASSSGENGKDTLTSNTTLVASDEGESHHSRDEPHRHDHSQDSSVEYIGTSRKEMRRVLPHLPDLTTLRLLEENI